MLPDPATRLGQMMYPLDSLRRAWPAVSGTVEP
jgi:hypothetical protein